MDLCNLFTYIFQGYFTGTRTIIWLSQFFRFRQSNPKGYGQIYKQQTKTKQNTTSANHVHDSLHALYTGTHRE